MSNSGLGMRNKLYDYIRVADDKKINAIYHLLENEIEQTKEWWKDKHLVEEFDTRYQALEKGTDKGLSVTQMNDSIDKLRTKKYGK